MSGHTLAPGFLVVPQHVARNPVARAVQRQRLYRATRDFGCRLLLLPDGEQVAADALASATVLTVAISVADAQATITTDALEVMRRGHAVLVQLSERGFVWRRADAGALEHALEVAAEVVSQAPAALVQRAWVACEQANARADQRVHSNRET